MSHDTEVTRLSAIDLGVEIPSHAQKKTLRGRYLDAIIHGADLDATYLAPTSDILATARALLQCSLLFPAQCFATVFRNWEWQPCSPTPLSGNSGRGRSGRRPRQRRRRRGGDAECKTAICKSARRGFEGESAVGENAITRRRGRESTRRDVLVLRLRYTLLFPWA